MNGFPSTPFHTRLRQERIQRNWRQRDVADHLETTVVTVRRWERGSQQPSAYFRARLCTLFGKSAEELSLVEPDPSTIAGKEVVEARQPNITPPDEFTLWTVPYTRNPHFTGRADLLDRLAQHLSSEGEQQSASTRRAALTQPQAIKGLGGIGKTQIAVEYAYRAREQGHYISTLWVNATNQETILTSLVTLAQRLPAFPAREEQDQRKLMAAVKCWLEQCEQRWLLILDNADDLSLLQEFLPQQGNGDLLLTMRAQAVGSLAISIEVENMGLLEGTAFLLQRAQRQHAREEERNEAINVVIALDGFPLALDQAGAYLEETGCSFGDYLQIYQQHRQLLLAQRGGQATNYPNSVATTWSLNFQQVEQANPAAADLLRLCAFLAPDQISEELLREGTPYWTPILQQAAGDLFSFNQMLKELLKFSLVKRLKEDQTLSIHRLVQAVQMDTMAPEEQRRWAERAVRAINAVFPARVEVAAWPRCRRYLSQAQASSVLIQAYAFAFEEAASLLHRTADYLQDCAFYEQAEPLYQRALHMREQIQGSEHLNVAHTLNRQAILYIKQGKYGEAELLFQRALRIRERVLGLEHPDVASLFNNLASLYSERGKHVEAEPLLQRALRIREQALGLDHPHVASSLNNLAVTYNSQGKYAEAEPLYRRALHIREQAFGPDHLHVAQSLENLADFYRSRGRVAEAEPLCQRAIRIREKALGLDHPDLAPSLNNLADLSRTQGRYAEAEVLYQRALHIRERALGPDHFRVAYTLHGLATLYSMQGKAEQAEPLYRRAVRIREQALEPHHPDLAEILHDFAAFQQTQGNNEEAAFLYQHALAIREQSLGPRHPQTVETRTRYLMQLRAMGREEDATRCNLSPS